MHLPDACSTYLEDSQRMGVKCFFINGSTRGLGFALTKKLIAPDHRIYCIVRDLSQLSGLEAFRRDIHLIPCDYSNTEDVRALKDRHFANIDFSDTEEVFFINNIGSTHPVSFLGNFEMDELINSISINITSNLLVVNSFVSTVQHYQQDIFLLNISSGISRNPVPGMLLYGLSKVYMDYMTLHYKSEINNRGDSVYVAAFYPGGMETDLQQELQEALRETARQTGYDYDRIIYQKLRSVEEIAGIIIGNFIENKNGWDNSISSIHDYIAA